MILRARPKFLVEDFFNYQPCQTPSEGMYFNYGRTALAFLLQIYSTYKNKKLKVGIQSFNCEVSAWAVLVTHNDLHLFDIKKEDFSLDLNSFIKNNIYLDVLVLTHYQGIPNIEYKEVVEYCASNNILLIDDVAQTEYSYFDGELVGTLADFSIHSFSFDKPYTTWTGGELKIQKCQDEILISLLKEKYSTLKFEEIKKEFLDIKLLHFLWIYSDLNKFHVKLNNRYLLRLCINWHISFKWINRLMIFFPKKIVSVLNRVVYKFQLPRIQIERLGNMKIALLKRQQQMSLRKLEYVIPQEIARGKELFYKDSSFINWNRYSVLDEKGEMKKALLRKGIEVGNYNWPEPLDVKFKGCCHVFLHGNYEITHYVAKNVINIPIWPYLKIYGEQEEVH